MKIILSKSIFLLAVLLCAVGAFAAPPESAKDAGDPILRSLRAEMDRSKSKLHLENMPAPYFIDYRVVDVDSWEADAALGGVRSETHTRIRFLLVQVRLGDYKQDNSSAHGGGVIEVVPLDSDEHAFRFQVWSATDKAYKQAAVALTDKQARLKQMTIDHPVDDFARAEPVQLLQPTVELKVEHEPWLKMLRDASGLYARDPQVQLLEASLDFKAVNRYYLNSEGTVVRSGEQLFRMSISGNTQADDGMRLERSAEFTAKSREDLPNAAEFQERASTMLASLKQLREAPLADEDYHGPVLLSADSSSTIFAALVGDNLRGSKPELGQNARVRGQFASSYKTRVLPDFLSLTDDPTISSLEGTALLGHYDVDDEGVKAQRVPLVEKGILVNFLLGRQPIRDFPSSNGHGRASLPLSWPAPGIGNLVVRSSDAVAPEELKKKLIAICKDRGLDYGYYAEAMGGIRAPRLLYRVWTQDGREELVRGALFGDLDQRSMRSNIVAAGNDSYVDNEIQPVPHSIIAPSILFDDLEVKRQTSNKDKLPEYPAPETTKKVIRVTASYNLLLPLHPSEAPLDKPPAPLVVSPWFDQLRVVLVRSRNPLNIGAAARAMSNFGFQKLRLVTPWEPSYLGARSAVGASQVLLNAEVFGSVAEAVADCSLVVGTSAVGERELHHPVHGLEQAAELMRQGLAATPVALLFGSEKFGLSNEDLSHCHWLTRIPTRDSHISMNLGQAVAICLYELARSSASATSVSEQTPADAAEVERIMKVLFEALCISGYVQSAGEAAAQEKLRRMLRRLNLEKSDAELWLGMMRQILWKTKHSDREKD